MSADSRGAHRQICDTSHPTFVTTPDLTGTLLFDDYDLQRNQAYRSLEGGNVLVLSPEVLMIGCSERRANRQRPRAPPYRVQHAGG